MKVISRVPTEFLSMTDVWHIHSDRVDDVFRVCVSAPEVQPCKHKRFGVVYALDAGLFGGALVNVLRGCHLGGELPPLYGVSIGYTLAACPHDLIQRTRDLTPTTRPDFDAVFPLLFKSTQSAASGGAKQFLTFLSEELRPLLEREYAIDHEDATLVGASLGGLFVLSTLLTDSVYFRRYLAISPSIWWDQRLLIRRAEMAVRSSHAPQAQVYMCAGALETRENLESAIAAMPKAVRTRVPSDMRNADMQSDLREFHDVCSVWDGERFRIRSYIYPEESHNSIGPAALSRGLRTLHGTLSW